MTWLFISWLVVLGLLAVVLNKGGVEVSKERLDYIVKDTLVYENKDLGGKYVELAEAHYKWLIEQAERVEEFELEVNDWRAEVQKWQKFYKESEESCSETKELLESTVNQNKRYREALEFYASRSIYEPQRPFVVKRRDGSFVTIKDDVPPTVIFDGGKIARQALEGENE